MQLRSLVASAFAAAAIFTPAVTAQAYSTEGVVVTSATTTYTLTRTVERVVSTEYATFSGTITPTGTTTASLTLTPYANGTASAWSTGVMPSGSAVATQSAIPIMPANGANSQYAIEAAGVAAFAGFVGMLFA